MKKIFGVIALVILAAGGYFGYQYYQETYVGQSYYAIVPQEVPVKEATVDNSGKEVPDTYSYNYDITWADKEGKIRQWEVEVSGSNPQPLTPGSYVTAEISQKRIVLGPNNIEENKIPPKALAALKK